MTLRTLCVACVGTASLLPSLLAVGTAQFFDLPIQLAATGIGLVGSIVFALYLSTRLRNECACLANLLIGDDLHRPTSNRISDFESIAAAMKSSMQKWENAAAASRRQAQDFSNMMQALDQRAGRGQPDSNQLRALLAGLGVAVRSQLNQCSRLLAEAQQQTNQTVEQAGLQVGCIASVTDALEQSVSLLDSMSLRLKHISDSSGTSSLLTELHGSLGSLTLNLEKISVETGRCERRLSGLSEPTKELNATIQSIAELASRTDLLALNASIESLRAGEHGKGFAIVADEVRKMAEQIAEATRELASVLDSIQLAITETTRAVSNGQYQLDAQTSQTRAIQTSLSGAIRTSQADQEHCLQIAATAQDQRRLMVDANNWLKQTTHNAVAVQRLGDSIQSFSTSVAQSLSQASIVANRLAACKDSSVGELEVEQVPVSKSWAENEADQRLSPQLAIQR
jgi:methyl-accepting chemotaxis protein